MIFNATVFGAGSGGVLIVNAPAGVIVTAVNEASGKTYNRTANDDGIAIFKGLINGVWELSITDGERTSESIFVEITTNYKTTLAFFEAYINVTYPANSTCTCTSKTDNTVVFTDVNNTDAEKTITFTVPYKDTWTLNVTDGNQTDTMEVEITSEEQEEIITLAYFKAYIDVTYPSGSTCTCTNSTSILTAPDTNGQVVFSIPSKGIWTVSCTANDGSDNTKSETVEISTEGQFETVELYYDLVLYNAGDDGSKWETYTSQSGGYINFNETQIVAYSAFTMGGYAKSAAYYKESIIGGQYSTLTVIAGDTYTGAVGGTTSVGIVTETGLATVTSGADNPTCVSTVSIASANSEYTLDLSTLTEGEIYYIVFWARGRNLTSDSVVRPTTFSIASMIAE